MHKAILAALIVFFLISCSGKLKADEVKKTAVKKPVSSKKASVQSKKPAAAAKTNLQKLSDPDPLVRRNAVIYLGMEKNKNNIIPLLKMLNDENVEVRRAAINALANIGDARAVKTLIEKFSAENIEAVKVNIIYGLGELKDSGSVEFLKNLLKDTAPTFRSEAMRALSKINNPDTYSDLINMLNDDAEGVRVMAAEVAGTLKLNTAVPFLVKNLNNPVPVVRRTCIMALGQIGDASVIPELENSLKDRDSNVALAAKEALENIKKSSLPKEQQAVETSSGTIQNQ